MSDFTARADAAGAGPWRAYQRERERDGRELATATVQRDRVRRCGPRSRW